MMYKTILVPLDGSRRAEAILPHVEQITHPKDGQLIFLMVVDQPFLPERDEVADLSRYQEAFEKRKQDALTYLEKIKNKYTAKGFAVDVRVGAGPVVSHILKTGDEMNADVIAMSSHGYGGSERLFYGSTAAGILQRVDRPLLIIRTRKI
ncbi:MAG: universal stress protein [Desulfobacterales bacterium]